MVSIQGRVARHRVFGELPPKLRLADAGHADDQRQAAARIAGLAKILQAPAQRGEILGSAGEVGGGSRSERSFAHGASSLMA